MFSKDSECNPGVHLLGIVMNLTANSHHILSNWLELLPSKPPRDVGWRPGSRRLTPKVRLMTHWQGLLFWQDFHREGFHCNKIRLFRFLAEFLTIHKFNHHIRISCMIGIFSNLLFYLVTNNNDSNPLYYNGMKDKYPIAFFLTF